MALDGWRTVVVLAANGRELTRHELDLPPDAAVGFLRTTLDAAGNRWWPFAGGVYFLQAVKRVTGMRVIMPRWSESRRAKPALAVVPRRVRQRVRQPEGVAARAAAPQPQTRSS